jgi:alpha-galactosidase
LHLLLVDTRTTAAQKPAPVTMTASYTALILSALLAAQKLGLLVQAYDNGVAATPPMGWSSWCTNDLCGIPDRCSEYEVRNKADAMVSQGMVQMGYRWMLLDDCWSDSDRDANGELQPSPKLFPSGMKALADYLHERGMYLGLYSCVGTETCKKNRPGSYGHYETDANTFAKWGADMVKADYCNKPSNETGKDLYTQFSAALNATGRPILFAMCQWGEDEVYNWGGDIAQMYRIQMDHIPFWNFGPSAAGEGYGTGTKNIIDYMGDLHPSKYVRPHAWMDPDFLETMFEPYTMNFTNSRTEFSFWSLWSAPLLMATDPANLSDEKRSIIMNPEVIAINQDKLFTAGERIRNDNTTTGGQVWSRPLQNGDVAVILFNSGNHNDVTVGVTWPELGWASEDQVSIRDLWAQKTVGTQTQGVESVLAAHDVSMLRLTRVDSKK